MACGTVGPFELLTEFHQAFAFRREYDGSIPIFFRALAIQSPLFSLSDFRTNHLKTKSLKSRLSKYYANFGFIACVASQIPVDHIGDCFYSIFDQ